MRRIDLFCKLAGPLFVSVLTIPSPAFAALFLAGSNIVSLPFEYYFILILHGRFPELAVKALSPNRNHVPGPFTLQVMQWPQRTLSSWKTYYRSPLFAASLSLCILYFTVLSFGGVFPGNLVNFRLHDCLPLAILRLLNSTHRRSPCYRSYRRNRRDVPISTSDPLYWPHKIRNLVSFLAIHLSPPCSHNDIPPTQQTSPRWSSRGFRLNKSSWPMGIRPFRAISRSTGNPTDSF